MEEDAPLEDEKPQARPQHAMRAPAAQTLVLQSLTQQPAEGLLQRASHVNATEDAKVPNHTPKEVCLSQGPETY